MKLDAQMLGGRTGVVDVALPGTVAEDVVLVDPVLHVRAHDVMPLLLQQQGGDGAVDSAGHRDEDFFRHDETPTHAGPGPLVKPALMWARERSRPQATGLTLRVSRLSLPRSGKCFHVH